MKNNSKKFGTLYFDFLRTIIFRKKLNKEINLSKHICKCLIALNHA